jgi:pimeloyl-ACP methyl ester carboxylesterase
MHGWPVCSHHWQHTAPWMKSKGFRIVTIGLKGLGESTQAQGSFGKAHIADELLRLIEVETFQVVGHDWGGSVALAMAALAPDRVSRVVIEEEMAPGIGEPLPSDAVDRYPTWHGDFHRVAGLAEGLLAGREELYVNFFLDLRADPASLNFEDRRHYLSHCRSEAKTAWALAYYRARADDIPFFRELERKPIPQPVLAIGGRFAMGASVGASARRVASNVVGVVLAESGHYPAEEQADEFNETVGAFLDRGG